VSALAIVLVTAMGLILLYAVLDLFHGNVGVKRRVPNKKAHRANVHDLIVRRDVAGARAYIVVYSDEMSQSLRVELGTWLLEEEQRQEETRKAKEAVAEERSAQYLSEQLEEIRQQLERVQAALASATRVKTQLSFNGHALTAKERTDALRKQLQETSRTLLLMGEPSKYASSTHVTCAMPIYTDLCSQVDALHREVTKLADFSQDN